MSQKKIQLHKGLSQKEVAKLSDETLASRGYKARQIGDTMQDGTIYAGVSPDTGDPIYTTAADAPRTMKFGEAKTYTAALDAHGRKDWRLPSQAELTLLFDNRVAIGGFDLSGTKFAGYYWSAEPYTEYAAWTKRFSNGERNAFITVELLSVRCVR